MTFPLDETTDTSPLTLRLGASWYPEQYDESTALADLRMMRELGFNAVRMGEFAWSRLEPSEGQYDTGWLKRCLDLAHEHGLGVLLCTPTAAPPPWVLAGDPTIGFVPPNGRRFGPGGRQAGDYCHPAFQALCRKIVKVLAEAFGGHPAVVGWHIDNELRGHQKVSVSDAAVAGWHRWLGKRYGDIDALNQAWGTHVWSQRYQSFEQVPAPGALPNYSHSFSLLTSYRRYMNDAVLDFQRQQVQIIRALSDAPITTNSEDSVDEWDATRDLDFAAHDCYTRQRPLPNLCYRTDCFRSLIANRRFWVAETDSEGSLEDGQLFPPGWLANFAMLSYAGGGEAVMYWPWRGTRSGTEIVTHSCLVHASGGKSSSWNEAAKAVELRDQMQPLLLRYRPAPAKVAFVRAERNGHYYYIDRIAGLEPEFKFRDRLESHHRTLQSLGVWRDVVYDHAEFDGYRLVFSPYLPYTSPHLIGQMRRHLEAGGTWVAGPYTGYLTEDHTIPTNAMLGDFEAEFGFKTKHFVPIKTLPVTLSNGLETQASMHAHVFEPGPDDTVLGTYGGDRLGGGAWGNRRRVGAGTLYVLGSEIGDDARADLYRGIAEEAGVAAFPMPDRVLRIPQIDAQGNTAWALVNGSRLTQSIDLPGPGRELFTDLPAEGKLSLPPNSNAFVEFNQPVQA